MRGLDAYLSRGHERLDDEPEPLHPDEASLLDYVDRQMRADAEREMDMAKMLVEMLRRVHDEEKGVALAARFERRA